LASSLQLKKERKEEKKKASAGQREVNDTGEAFGLFSLNGVAHLKYLAKSE
jgi:hypothetical protein